MPAISALSGNLGLQAGSNTIRGLGTGEPETDSVDIRVDNYRYCIVQGTSTRVTTCPTWCGRSGAASSPPPSSPQCWPGSPWSGHTATGTTSTSSKSSYTQLKNICHIEKYLPLPRVCRNPEHPFVFGGVIFLGTWISMIVSTVNGAGTPILVNIFTWSMETNIMIYKQYI